MHHADPAASPHIGAVKGPCRSTPRKIRRLLGYAAGGAGLLSLSGAAYVAQAWWRFGRDAGPDGADPLLDRFLPSWDVRERHQVRVHASPELTYRAARRVDLERSWLARTIFRGREWLFRQRRDARVQGPLVEQTLALGWGVLAEEPGRHLVMGAVTEPWRGDVRFRALPPGDFASFAEPGHAKIVWTLSVEPGPPGGSSSSVFRTETRVKTTDPASRARFRAYWAALSPGIRLIRREALRLVKSEAERHGRPPRIRRAAAASALGSLLLCSGLGFCWRQFVPPAHDCCERQSAAAPARTCGSVGEHMAPVTLPAPSQADAALASADIAAATERPVLLTAAPAANSPPLVLRI